MNNKKNSSLPSELEKELAKANAWLDEHSNRPNGPTWPEYRIRRRKAILIAALNIANGDSWDGSFNLREFVDWSGDERVLHSLRITDKLTSSGSLAHDGGFVSQEVARDTMGEIVSKYRDKLCKDTD